MTRTGHGGGNRRKGGKSRLRSKRTTETDETLRGIKKLVERGDPQFVRKDSLIYRRSSPTEDQAVEQLVLPSRCRTAVLKLAHATPLAGHLGRNKTIRRVLQRFYWPGVCRDVANHCRCCPECQKAQNRRAQPAPLVPLPVMAEPFSRIAMDIVGPLSRTQRFICVIPGSQSHAILTVFNWILNLSVVRSRLSCADR